MKLFRNPIVEWLKAIERRLATMETLMAIDFTKLHSSADALVATSNEVLDYIKSHPTGDSATDQAEADRLADVLTKVNSDIQAGLHPVVSPPPVV